jgi:hypothetical protein
VRLDYFAGYFVLFHVSIIFDGRAWRQVLLTAFIDFWFPVLGAQADFSPA